jgi:hypothetical protein
VLAGLEFALGVDPTPRMAATFSRAVVLASSRCSLPEAVSAARPGLLHPVTCSEQEFGYEVDVVECEVRAACVMDPPQRLGAAAYEP